MDTGFLPIPFEPVKAVPLAAVTLIRSRRKADPNLWLVLTCPICGRERRHRHGAGLPGQNPRDFLGRRVGHCGPPYYDGPVREYELVWVTGEAVEAVM
jgi:hypothetical protein